METFDERKACPRLLHCGHSFCTRCLGKRLLSEAQDATENFTAPEGSLSIPCPTCSVVTTLTSDVSGLPKNFALLDVLEEIKRQEGTKVSMCQACEEEHRASKCCLQCGDMMCQDAAAWHTRSKLTRKHRVVDLSEMESNPKLAASVSLFCDEHDMPFRFYDEECATMVCRDCVTLEHSGHNCSTLAAAASKCRLEMRELSKTGSDRAKVIKSAEERVAMVTNNLDQKSEEYGALIRSSFQELRTALNKREGRLMEQLRALHNAKADVLGRQARRLHAFHACLESAVRRVKTAVITDGEQPLLAGRHAVSSTLATVADHILTLDPEATEALDFAIDMPHVLQMLDTAGAVTDHGADAHATTAAGPGLENAPPGEEVTFVITARDESRALLNTGGDRFMVVVTAKGGARVIARVQDNGDGTYTTMFTAPKGASNARVSVTLSGVHIQDSPFTIAMSRFGVGLVGTDYPGWRALTLGDLKTVEFQRQFAACIHEHAGIPLLTNPLPVTNVLQIAGGWLQTNGLYINERGGHGPNQKVNTVYSLAIHDTEVQWPGSDWGQLSCIPGPTPNVPLLFVR